MAKFSDAFLQGLRGSGQRGSPTDPALQRADQYGSSNPLAKSIGGMFGMQMDTGQELAAKEMSAIDQEDPDALMQSLAVSFKYARNPQEKMLALSKLTELKQAADLKTAEQLKTQRTIESLKTRAQKVGLESMIPSIAEGFDLEEAAKKIREEEQRDLIKRQGAPARRSILKSVGITDEETVKSALTMSSDEFQEVIDGSNAEIQFFQVPPVSGTTQAEVRAFKVNNAGNVLDEKSGKWVTPSSLALSQPPQVVRTFNEANSILEATGEVFKGTLEKVFADAADAQEAYDISVDGLKLIEEGIFTGAGAEFKSQASKLATLFSGGRFKGETAAQTEQFAANQLKAVGKFVKQFGSGAGITEKDVELATKAMGGDVKMSEQAIVRLLELSKEISSISVLKRNDIMDLLAAENMSPTQLAILKRAGSSNRARNQASGADAATPEAPPPASAYNANTLDLMKRNGII